MRKKINHGQATVEFAFVIPIIVVLILGVQFVGPRIVNSIALTNAVRAGARAAADAADSIEESLSCNPPATYQCVQSGENTMKAIVDAGLKGAACPDSPPAGQKDPPCISAVHVLAGEANTYGFQVCIAFATNGCNTAGSFTDLVFINNAITCTDDLSCIKAAEKFSMGAIEAGLGCTTSTDCPPPIGGGANPITCTVPPPATPTCQKTVSEEIIAGVAQKALACLAVRRALELPTTVTVCNSADDVLGQLTPDDPIMDLTVPPDPHPGLIPNVQPCPTGVKAELFADAAGCASPAHNKLYVERVTVHWKGLTATATAAPISQFLIG